MKRLIIGLIFLALGASFANAQNPVVTQTYPATAYITSSTISTSNIFQSIWPPSLATTGRTDCLIQNNGAATMYIYFGAVADALTTSSLQLAAGAIFRCANSGIAIRNAISITGTTTQRYFAIQE